jgi:hypothetical protein
MFFKKGRGGAVGVYMEPRGRWTENVWEPLVYRMGLSSAALFFPFTCPAFSAARLSPEPFSVT